MRVKHNHKSSVTQTKKYNEDLFCGFGLRLCEGSVPEFAVRLCVSPLRVYAAFPNNQHKFIAFF